MLKKILIFLIFILNFTISPCCSPISYAESGRSTLAKVERLFLEGRYEKVIQEIDFLIDSRSSQRDELYYIKGLSRLKLDRFKEAREDFERVISRFPRSRRVFDAYVGVGDSYFLEGNTNAAIRTYQDILNRYSHNVNISAVYYRLGNCFKNIGSYDNAKEHFDKVKGLSPLSFEARMAPGIASKKVQRSKADDYLSVQVGSFRNKKYAERLAHKLVKEGFDSFIEMPGNLTGDRLYRVKVGKFDSKERAEALASKLRSLGYDTKVCTNDLCS